MSTLAQLEARVAARLIDASNAVFTTATLDEALQSALDEYTQAWPLTLETVITLPGDGREIALNGVSGLISVQEVWWPFDSDATQETWPPNQVRGFRVWWDDAQPVLFLNVKGAAQPQAADELRLWYSAAHTIQNLASAATTTVFPHHESGLVSGAAGYAVLSQDVNQLGAVRLDRDEAVAAREWGRAQLREFRAWLKAVAAQAPTHGEPFGPGWRLDRFDDQEQSP